MGNPQPRKSCFLPSTPRQSAVAWEKSRRLSSPGPCLFHWPQSFPIKAFSEGLGGFNRIVRMIPNAPSLVNEGYNPVTFGPGITTKEKKTSPGFSKSWATAPRWMRENSRPMRSSRRWVPPTCGFSSTSSWSWASPSVSPTSQAWKGIRKMLKGALETIDESGLSPDEVMDLIPVKPLGEDEAMIRNAYRTKLTGLYQKLKG